MYSQISSNSDRYIVRTINALNKKLLVHLEIEEEKNNVGITLSHNLLGMATMERIKFALSLNGYESHY